MEDLEKFWEKMKCVDGGAFNENTKINSSIVPDFTIKIIDGELKLELNSRNAPELYVSRKKLIDREIRPSLSPPSKIIISSTK